ncbi:MULTISPECIES: DUF4880 domain-containing protein [unclassified Symbiopectobacterium]|uniref:DUF4880 domain-containing protein n=1 Tax=unclassified Symbiopectobacterium TaxID=2794573 RepID=UPI0022279B23|nr:MULTISPECIES: DUF4880 domain-containing protein [unclassified Symbiopectobacterium]MCW2475175.1 DUF4880 domain-containing protein [Candidatus Symbiopectobacterium sp. NZEC151]MCW2482724.1 DUF4880 domain-containing protein [Candidatus Symbiopectobacterium sp. NZEC135]
MRSDDIPQDVFYDAAEWYAILYADDCTANERHAWQQWLNSHPLHQQAWQRVEQIHTRFHSVDSPVASSVLSRQGTERRHLLKLLALMTLLGGGAYSVPWETYAADYRTAKGENRCWALAEGMTLNLNTDSALSRYDQDGKIASLRLLKGECLLESAVPYPLLFSTPQGELTLNSPCRFDVRCDDGESTLAVFQGEVLLRPAQQLQAAVRVLAGQQVTFTVAMSQPAQPVEGFRQSWLDGVLLADNMRLDSLMREYARYRNGYFPLDAKAAALRISGVFPLQDDARFFSALTRTLPIIVERRFSWWITLRAR